MRELSLHVLDLIENSTRAGARTVRVTLRIDAEHDLLELDVDDDGPGLSVSPEEALDPFYTTKKGKRTGLGLSLIRGSAEEAGGKLVLERSDLDGLRVAATMGLRNVDRHPLGDLAGTLAGVVCTNPDLDLRFRLSTPGREQTVRSAELSALSGRADSEPWRTASAFALRINDLLAEAGFKGL